MVRSRTPAHARHGIYPAAALAGMSAERLAKHFLRLLSQDGSYPEAERNLLSRLAEALDEQQFCGKA